MYDIKFWQNWKHIAPAERTDGLYDKPQMYAT